MPHAEAGGTASGPRICGPHAGSCVARSELSKPWRIPGDDLASGSLMHQRRPILSNALTCTFGLEHR